MKIRETFGENNLKMLEFVQALGEDGDNDLMAVS